MNTYSSRQEPTTPYSEPERSIHQTKKKKKINPFIHEEDRVPKVKYAPFENLYEALVVYIPFSDFPFLMADDQPMWGKNRAVAPTLRAGIIAVDLGENITIKGHHLSMIKDRQFDIRAWADPQKHIAEFVEICGMFRYGNTNVDAIKRKLFPLSLVGDAKDLLCSCHGHGLGRGTIIQIFYHGLDEATQAILDARGIFLYKTPNEAHRLLEDRVLLKLDWSKDIKDKPL
ncbi:hypothetical protein Tco_1350561 [Tanacetum coccineum]